MPSPSFSPICKLRSFPRCAAATTIAPTSEATATAPLPEATLYEVLGLTIGATSREIKIVHRRLARTCHPDVVAADRKAASADEFMWIHSA